MDLLQSFSGFIAKENLFSPGAPLLVAVSGGLDSVVLCELCHRAGYPFRMAHANFQLRGEESERDEQFVRQLAAKYQAELFLRRFDTQEQVREKKVSVQVAARELRYAWFREIAAREAGGDRMTILTAHHLDDNVETLLMNFFKGTGIAGLHGILPRQGNLVRPLLFAGKEELRQFALEHQLSWVEDSSNQSDKYSRNYLRQQVIPLVERLYPGALGNLGENIPRFREAEALYRQSVDQHKNKLMERRGGEILIPVLKLKRSEPLHTLVYEIIHPFGFSPRQVDEVLRLLDSGSGKYMLSATHRILKDRNWLIISPLDATVAVNILVESAEDKISYEGGELALTLLPVQEVDAPGDIVAHPVAGIAGTGKTGEKEKEGQARPGAQTKGKEQQKDKDQKKAKEQRMPLRNAAMVQAPNVAMLDAGEICFPLLLRKWRQGDYFYPLGMRKKKKLGRFFIDSKLSRTDKEKIWVIEMDKKIIWVVGLRIDDRFRIKPATREILKIEMRLG